MTEEDLNRLSKYRNPYINQKQIKKDGDFLLTISPTAKETLRRMDEITYFYNESSLETIFLNELKEIGISDDDLQPIISAIGKSKDSDTCPECGGKIISIPERGEITCSQCGLVIEVRITEDFSSKDLPYLSQFGEDRVRLIQFRNPGVLYHIGPTNLKPRRVDLDRRDFHLSKKRFQSFNKTLKSVLKLYKTKILERATEIVPITIFSIHSPKVNGAKCTYLESNTYVNSVNYGLKFLGVKGGRQSSLELRITEKYQANDGRCYDIIKNAVVEVEKCVELYRGKAVTEPYLRPTLIRLEEGYIKKPIDLLDDQCEKMKTKTECYTSCDLTNAIDPDTKEFKITDTDIREFSLTFNCSPLQSEVSFGGSNSSLTSKTFTCFLPGKNMYKVHELEDSFGYAWVIEK
ncbi:MAG: TFIIB-type zinc ribbon-containing protein [Promethearchaeota archaeon]